MSANTLASPMPGSPDPNAVGRELMSIKRRSETGLRIRVAAVWIGLVVLLIVGLLTIRFSPQYMIEHAGFVLLGAGVTVFVSVVSILIAAVLALLGALGRLSASAIAQGVSSFYISVIRGTPLLIQIYLIYLGLPQIGQQLVNLGIPQGSILILDAVPAGILALSLNYGAYMTEIFRAGIQSISYGQREAALAMGMTRWQMMRRIVLPQAIRVIIPDIGNQFIAMQKDSALVSVMGVWEITFRASRFARKDAKFMEMFLLAALLYWILTIISSRLQDWLEKRMAHAYER